MVRRSFAAAFVFALVVVGAEACGSDHGAPPAGSLGPPVDATVAPQTLGDGAADAPTPIDAPAVEAAPDAPLDATDADVDAACMTTVTAYAPIASPHVPVCSTVTYASNPPTSGPHYDVWAAYRAFTVPVPRGFYVHDLEHGAVVVLYNCPTGCAQDVADLEAFLNARAADPLCSGAVKNRFVVTPDPKIPTRFAAAAWGYAVTSNCFDLSALGAFIDAHYAHSPENLCADGTDVTAADAGIAADCGN